MPPPIPASAVPDAAAVRRPLLAWFDVHARDLPWRRTGDPYAVWVSEVMLQQTRVDTVVPYYRRWLERFPDLPTLADAPEEDVLKAWEGLGYYRRARMLHRAAAVVRERHGGEVPARLDALRALPGVGEYTAAAVASIAFGEAVAAVDGNVRRVLARLCDVAEPRPAWLRDTAAALLDPARPGDFNQALMELGATVCTPRTPQCPRCPLAPACAARAAGSQVDRPAARPRRTVPTRRYAVAVVVAPGPRGPRALLVRRDRDGLLGGLWEFPSLELTEGPDGGPAPGAGATGRVADGEKPVGASAVAEHGGERTWREAERFARRVVRGQGLDVGPAPARRLAPVRHAYSHFRGIYRPFVMEAACVEGSAMEGFLGEGSAGEGSAVEAAAAASAPDARTWADRDRLAELPLPRAHRRIADALGELLDAAAG